MNKVIVYGLKVNGLDETVGTYGELLDLVKETREDLKKIDPTKDGPASRRALERYAAAKEAQKQFNATVRETQKSLAAAADEEGSYRQLQNTMSVLKRQFKELSREERSSQIGEDLKARTKEISDELKEIDAELGDYFRNVGNYEGGVAAALSRLDFAGLLKGDLSSITNLTDGLGGASDATAGLAAQGALLGPAFAVGAIAAGITGLISLLKESIEATREARQLLSVGGGVSNEDLNSTTGRLLAISEELGESTQSTFRAANSVAKNYNITLEESLDLIEKATLSGANVTGELLDQAREYPVFFRELGVSASQFFSIVSQSAKQGIFSDKGVDAIKEAELSLRELPKTARDAVNALGIDDATISQVKSEQGVLGLMQLVIDRFGELNPQGELAGQVLADIFKGAGEDAGAEFIASLDLTNEGIEKQIDLNNRYTREQQARIDQTAKLRQEQAEIEERIGPTAAKLELLQARAEGELFTVLSDLVEVGGVAVTAFSDLGDEVQEFFDIIPGGNATLKFLADQFQNLISPLLALPELIRNTRGALEKFGLLEADSPGNGSSFFGAELLEEQEQQLKDAEARAERIKNQDEGFGVFALPETAEEKEARLKREEEAKKAREQRAKDAEAARKALTGLKEIQAQILEINEEIAGFTGDAAALDVLNAQASQLVQLEEAMRTNGLRLISEAQAALPEIDVELDRLYQNLKAPDADFETIFSQIINTNEQRALLINRLTAVQEGLATPEQIAELQRQVDFLNRPDLGLTELPTNSSSEQVSSGKNLEDLAAETREETSKQFADAQIERAQAIEQAYQQTAQIASQAFGEFFASGERDAEAFARAATNAVLSGMDQQIQALAFQAGVQIQATVPPPGGLILGGLATAGILAGWEGLKASLQSFEEGGMINGPRHTGGGVNINAEGGEFILKRTAMSSRKKHTLSGTTAEIASYLNTQAGGRGLRARRPDTYDGARLYMKEGGMVPLINRQANSSGSLSADDVARIADAVANGVSGVADAVERGTERGVLGAEDLKIRNQPIAV